jgi:hypothetical protein
MRISKFSCPLIFLATLLAGCTTSPAPVVPHGQPISSTPDLSPYAHIELYAQNAGSAEPPLQMRSKFLVGSAQFEVSQLDGSPVGRLHVQPEACRDDPSPYCERRFTISGRLQAMNANLSCIVQVRNDSNVAYWSQTLSGLCQSQYGRVYTLQMFAR